MVGIVDSSLQSWTKSLGLWLCSHLEFFYVQQMNWVNTRNGCAMTTAEWRLSLVHNLLYGISDGLLADKTPDCPECSSVCGDRNKVVWSYYTSAASTSLASSASAKHLQVGYDHLQVPSWSGAVLLGWRVHPHFVGRRQVAVAVGSADSGTLVVPRTRSTIGWRDFALSGPDTWNSLSVELQTSSLSSQTFVKNSKIIYPSASASEDFCLIGAT